MKSLAAGEMPGSSKDFQYLTLGEWAAEGRALRKVTLTASLPRSLALP